jgi:hypothetical protein
MEDLKKAFIVDEKAYEKEKIPEQIKKVLKYGKVTKEGRVLLEKNNLTIRDNLKIILIARFLASKLDESIREDITIDEIVASMGTDNKESLITRMKEIVDEGVAKRLASGVYVIVPFFVDTILDKFDKKMKNE